MTAQLAKEVAISLLRGLKLQPGMYLSAHNLSEAAGYTLSSPNSLLFRLNYKESLFAHGKVVEYRFLNDEMSFLQQVGALP